MTGDADHWERVYGARSEEALTWFEREPSLSARLISEHSAPDASVIDIGGGASRLPDALLSRGRRRLAVVDLSQAAPDVSRGASARGPTWCGGSRRT
jgi:hypothetical protein